MKFNKTILIAAFFGAGMLASQAALVSFNFRGPGTSGGNPATPMGAIETAGAPGVNDDNWNDVLSSTGGTITLPAGSVVDGTGATVPGMTLTQTVASAADMDVNATNDLNMFGDKWDIFGSSGSVDGTSEGTVTVTNIPYATYDVYVYTAGNTTSRGGEIWANGMGTGTRKSLRHVSSSHNTYVEADSSDPFSGSTPQGTYVVFRGLTGSTLTLDYDVDVRFGQSGIQIVPEPSMALFSSLGLLCLLRRRRG